MSALMSLLVFAVCMTAGSSQGSTRALAWSHGWISEVVYSILQKGSSYCSCKQMQLHEHAGPCVHEIQSCGLCFKRQMCFSVENIFQVINVFSKNANMSNDTIKHHSSQFYFYLIYTGNRWEDEDQHKGGLNKDAMKGRMHNHHPSSILDQPYGHCC